MKKVFYFLFISISIFLTNLVLFAFSQAPTFESVVKDVKGQSQYEYNVRSNNTLLQNLKNIFFPTSSGGEIWSVLSKIGFALFVVMFIWAGYLFISNADNESELKKAKLNILYLSFGALLFFGSVYIVGNLLGLPHISDTQKLTDNIKNQLFFLILSFLKIGAFFVAIVMLILYGFRVIMAYEKEDKISEGRKGVINVILALIFIKIIDYVYYLALQQDFMTQAGNFLILIIKGLLYILGIIIVLVMIYAAYLLIFSRGDEEAWKKFKNIVTTVFLVIVVLVLFVLIIYTILANFTGER